MVEKVLAECGLAPTEERLNGVFGYREFERGSIPHRPRMNTSPSQTSNRPQIGQLDRLRQLHVLRRHPFLHSHVLRRCGSSGDTIGDLVASVAATQLAPRSLCGYSRGRSSRGTSTIICAELASHRLWPPTTETEGTGLSADPIGIIRAFGQNARRERLQRRR